VLGTVTLAQVNGSAQAAFTSSALALGVHNITAIYGGSDTSTSSSASLAQTVNQGTTTTAVSSSASPASYGQSVTLTATVAPTTGPGVPTGTVTFLAAGGVLGTGTLANVNGSAQATLTTSTLDYGDVPILAFYGGDSSYAASTSDIFDQWITS
jgi:hypothetical protein